MISEGGTKPIIWPVFPENMTIEVVLYNTDATVNCLVANCKPASLHELRSELWIIAKKNCTGALDPPMNYI